MLDLLDFDLKCAGHRTILATVGFLEGDSRVAPLSRSPALRNVGCSRQVVVLPPMFRLGMRPSRAISRNADLPGVEYQQVLTRRTARSLKAVSRLQGGPGMTIPAGIDKRQYFVHERRSVTPVTQSVH